MPYDERMVKPMREECIVMGLQELKSAGEVDAALSQAKGTTLLFVNSVCGCAAGGARPALRAALKHSIIPQGLFTVFAGQDLEATRQARQYFSQYQPSSPSLALLRDGKPVYMLHRHMIEGRSPAAVAADLIAAFDRHCGVTIG